jgi:putative ribosome biogenesis GTPase RsgA
VRAAVEDGRVSEERYDSYLRLREEHEQLEEDLF